MAETQTFFFWGVKSVLLALVDALGTFIGVLVGLLIFFWLLRHSVFLAFVFGGFTLTIVFDGLRILLRPFVFPQERIELDEDRMRYIRRGKKPVIDRPLSEVYSLNTFKVFGQPHSFAIAFDGGQLIEFDKKPKGYKTLVKALEARTGKTFVDRGPFQRQTQPPAN